MVEAMGGSDSAYYRAFRTYCCEAYNILRKSASLILSLFHLMAGAAIPDVRQDPEKAMLKLQVCPAGLPCWIAIQAWICALAVVTILSLYHMLGLVPTQHPRLAWEQQTRLFMSACKSALL